MATDTSSIGRLDYITSATMLRESYDTAYQLNTGRRLVAMTEEEKSVAGSLFMFWAAQFKKYRIRHHFGYTLDEYTAMPRTQMQALNELARKAEAEEVNENEELVRQLNLSDTYGS